MQRTGGDGILVMRSAVRRPLIGLTLSRVATTTPTWAALVAAIRELKPAVRVKWTGDEQATPWEPWLIVPHENYLETGSMGPVPFAEVEWVEVDPRRKNGRGRLVDADQSLDVSRALLDSQIAFKRVDGVYRIAADAG